MVVGRIVGHECLQNSRELHPILPVCPHRLAYICESYYRPRHSPKPDSDKASVVISDHNRVLSQHQLLTLRLDEDHDHQAPSSWTAKFASIQLDGAYSSENVYHAIPVTNVEKPEQSTDFQVVMLSGENRLPLGLEARGLLGHSFAVWNHIS